MAHEPCCCVKVVDRCKTSVGCSIQHCWMPSSRDVVDNVHRGFVLQCTTPSNVPCMTAWARCLVGLSTKHPLEGGEGSLLEAERMELHTALAFHASMFRVCPLHLKSEATILSSATLTLIPHAETRCMRPEGTLSVLGRMPCTGSMLLGADCSIACLRLRCEQLHGRRSHALHPSSPCHI